MAAFPGPAPAGPGGWRSPRRPFPKHTPYAAAARRARAGPGVGLRRRDRVGGAGRYIRAFAGSHAHPGTAREAGAGLRGADRPPWTRFGRQMPEPRATALPSAPFSRLLGPGLWLPRWAEEVGARCWHISRTPDVVGTRSTQGQPGGTVTFESPKGRRASPWITCFLSSSIWRRTSHWQVVGSGIVEMQGKLQGFLGDDMELWAGACPLLGPHS